MSRHPSKLTSQNSQPLEWLVFTWCQWRENRIWRQGKSVTDLYPIGNICCCYSSSRRHIRPLIRGKKQEKTILPNQSSEITRQNPNSEHLLLCLCLSQLNISFNESSLQSTYEYPSEGSVWDSGEEDEEERRDEKVPDEQHSMVGRIHIPRPGFSSSPNANSNGEAPWIQSFTRLQRTAGSLSCRYLWPLKKEA